MRLVNLMAYSKKVNLNSDSVTAITILLIQGGTSERLFYKMN